MGMTTDTGGVKLTPVGMTTDTGRRETWELTPGNEYVLNLALARARVSVPTEPRFDCANVLRRTHCIVRRSSISSERDFERSFVSHSNSKGEGHGTTPRDARTPTPPALTPKEGDGLWQQQRHVE